MSEPTVIPASDTQTADMSAVEILAVVAEYVRSPAFSDRLADMRREMAWRARGAGGEPLTKTEVADMLQLDLPFVDLLWAFDAALARSTIVLAGADTYRKRTQH